MQFYVDTARNTFENVGVVSPSRPSGSRFIRDGRDTGSLSPSNTAGLIPAKVTNKDSQFHDDLVVTNQGGNSVSVIRNLTTLPAGSA
jgi:hypothetical protein